ncbi:MAG: putative metal-binding motif-containing protein [Sandaracinus sp.]|nr:putative metal-binding motif-containing protein [Sandaracinus sp.]
MASLLACGDDDASTDAATSDALVACRVDADCDDGVFCNGAERCGGSSILDERGCAASSPPCREGQLCDETADRCRTDCTISADADGDGVAAEECGGEDCDDSNADRSPRLTERCDAAGLDEDCDASTVAGPDDGDVDGDGVTSALCCNATGGEMRCGEDCDDRSASTQPEAVEACNDVDDDCDGSVDEGVLTLYTVDVDGDGFGSNADDAATRLACTRPEGFREDATDCDDSVATTHPAAWDFCDEAMVDDDCNGMPNDLPPTGCTCTDQQRPCPLFGACAASTQECRGGRWLDCGVMPVEEACGNAIDDDCDGEIDERCACEGEARPCGSDVGLCSRGAQACLADGTWGECLGVEGPTFETCDGRDEDCDGRVDEGSGFDCFLDADRDGYAVGGVPTRVLCGGSTACPTGESGRLGDCDDGDSRARPNQTVAQTTPRNTVGGYDFNCDGRTMLVSSTPVLTFENCQTPGGPDMGACGSGCGRVELSVCMDMGSSGDFPVCVGEYMAYPPNSCL